MSSGKIEDRPDLYRLLLTEVERHPYRAVAIAAGVGYLLGTRLGGPLIAMLSSGKGMALASSVIGALINDKGTGREPNTQTLRP